MSDPGSFEGAKIAVLVGNAVLVMRRDNRPDIPWPDHWDLAGGGREGEETPLECALRELHEEFGLVLDPARVSFHMETQSAQNPKAVVVFFGARWDDLDPAEVTFGAEGQDWCLMPLPEFIAHPRAIPSQVERLLHWLGPQAL